MKTRLLIITAVAFSIFGYVQYADAWCPENNDWPDAPCYGCPDCYPELEQEKLDWAPYYDYKGEYWIEQKRYEMQQAIQNSSLEKWLELDESHRNVHQYYYLQGEAPDLNGNYVFTCNMYEDALRYEEILKDDAVLKKFLRVFPSATSSLADGIDESRPPQASILYQYEKYGVNASLLLRIFEGEDEKPCLVPRIYAITYQDNTDMTEIRNSNTDTGEILDFLESLLFGQAPLKQITSGVSLIDVKCNEGKIKVIKYDRMMAACVNGNTESEVKLIDRGWALLRFIMPGENAAHALCNNYEGKWHPEHNGCKGDISDLQCSLMGGTFVDNLKICYNDICPENKTYTLCVTNPDESDSDIPASKPPPAPDSRQCKPGLPPFTSDFYLDKELCKWKSIPEPIPDEAIPYVWNSYLQKMQIGFSPKDVSYVNADEGFFPEKENRVCSPLILTNGSEFFISSTFTVEPFEMIDTVMSKTQPYDCHKIWKTEPLLVEPSPELGAWLKKYWEKENEY